MVLSSGCCGTPVGADQLERLRSVALGRSPIQAVFRQAFGAAGGGICRSPVVSGVNVLEEVGDRTIENREMSKRRSH